MRWPSPSVAFDQRIKEISRGLNPPRTPPPQEDNDATMRPRREVQDRAWDADTGVCPERVCEVLRVEPPPLLWNRRVHKGIKEEGTPPPSPRRIAPRHPATPNEYARLDSARLEVAQDGRQRGRHHREHATPAGWTKGVPEGGAAAAATASPFASLCDI